MRTMNRIQSRLGSERRKEKSTPVGVGYVRPWIDGCAVTGSMSRLRGSYASCMVLSIRCQVNLLSEFWCSELNVLQTDSEASTACVCVSQRWF